MALRLSESQIDAVAINGFLRRVVSIIAELDPSAPAVLGTPEGKQVLQQQYDNAVGYGLVAELDLGRYLVTAWFLGPDFDTRLPAMEEILKHRRMTPSQKMEAIERVTVMLFETLAMRDPA